MREEEKDIDNLYELEEEENLYNLEDSDDSYPYTEENDPMQDDVEESEPGVETYFKDSREGRGEEVAEKSYGAEEEFEPVDDEEDDEEDDDEDEEEEQDSKLNPALLLLKILAAPVEGWKALKRGDYSVEEIASGCFYPLVAIAAISEFATKMYGTHITIGACMLLAITTFIAFFFGYFTIILLGGAVLPKSAREIFRNKFSKEFVMMNVASLALFRAALNLCPMIDAVLVFLPFWTIYLIFKGVRFLRMPPEYESRTRIILSVLVVGVPVLWEWLIELLLSLGI